jgi:hypothetical protein
MIYETNVTLGRPWRFGVLVACVWIGLAGLQQSEVLALLALPLLAWLWLFAADRIRSVWSDGLHEKHYIR